MRTHIVGLLFSACLAACATASDPVAGDPGRGDAGAGDAATRDVVTHDAEVDALVDPDALVDAARDDVADAEADAGEARDASDADGTSDAGAADAGRDAERDVAEDASTDARLDAGSDVSSDASDAVDADAPLDAADAVDADASPDASDAGSDPSLPRLDAILAQLRASPGATVAGIATGGGWPLETDAGWLIVDVDTGLSHVAGDFDDWAGTSLTPDEGFSYALVPASPGDGYKFTDLASEYRADPWSRSYGYDDNGEISFIRPQVAHLERFFAVGDGVIAERRIRVWVPAEPVTHTLYAHDGQNLFEDTQASFGVSWELDESAPPGMMIVGVDNTPARLDEYGHVEDEAFDTRAGGRALDYAIYLRDTVRPLIRETYGEAERVGVMGSSMGGLVSLYIAHVQPEAWDMAISLSGALSWGRRSLDNPSIHELYGGTDVRGFAVYVDSGGGVSGDCVDTDADGLRDDGDDADDYCVTRQFADQLAEQGYDWETNLWHWHEPDALHNEAAWAARVSRPLEIFAAQ